MQKLLPLPDLPGQSLVRKISSSFRLIIYSDINIASEELIDLIYYVLYVRNIYVLYICIYDIHCYI